MLRENSRIPFLKIAKILKVSEAAVRKRVKKLESQGAIKKYTIEVNPKKSGSTNALIGIDTNQNTIFQLWRN